MIAPDLRSRTHDLTRHALTARVVAAIAIAGVVAACSTASGGGPMPSSTAGLPRPSTPTVDVEMQDYVFAPASVEIEVGTTVRWTNRGQAPHTATADDGSFDTGQIATGESAGHVFASTGTFTYLCTLHPDMRGTITVVAAASPAPTTEPTTEPSAPAPTATPKPSEPAPSEPAPAEPTRFDVPLTVATDHTVAAEVIDWTGLVTAATTGTPGDGASVPYDAVEIANESPTTLVVTWVGGPCDRTSTLVFDADRATMTVVQEPCDGDAIGFDRIVRLELAEPIDASSITGVLQAGGDAPG
jgi:plastocyanin